MTDLRSDGLIAIYNDPTHADLNFDSLVAFDEQIPFDAAVAVKADSGQVAILREHRVHFSLEARHAAGAGLAGGLFAVLVPTMEFGSDAASADAGRAMRLHLDHRKEFVELVGHAIDQGEAIVCLVCPESQGERFDRLLNDARRVVHVDVTHPATAASTWWGI